MTAPYAWLITHDHVSSPGERGDISTLGPRGVSDELERAIRSDDVPGGFTRAAFRMYDDDGILYYRGRTLYMDELEHSEDHVFGPLRDFGLPHAGCTRIRWNDDHHCETY